MDHQTGGWVLNLTCTCGMRQEFRGVVPSLTLDAAAKAGWDLPIDRMVKVVTNTEARCGYCRAEGAA